MIPHIEQKHKNNQLSLYHIGNLSYHQGKTTTSCDSINSLTSYNNHYTLLYPDLVQELFNFALRNSNSLKNNSHFFGGLDVNNTKTSSLDSSLSCSMNSLLSPRDILFFLQIVSLYQLELSKGHSSITYPSLKLAKILGVDASCDTTHLTANTHNSVNSLTDANMRATILKMTSKLEALGLLKVFRRKRKNGMDMTNKLVPVLPDRLHTRLKDLPSNLKVSASSKQGHESNLEHILRTKLFVPIELDFMKSLFKNNLPSKYKLFFLNCIMSAYRNFRQNSSNFSSSNSSGSSSIYSKQNSSSQFQQTPYSGAEEDTIDVPNMLSFSATSLELMKKNNISRSTLDRIFRYIKQQGDSFFLQVEHKYTKSDDIDCNRYDKSIFIISINPLVFPISHISEKNQSQTERITNFDCVQLQDDVLPIFPDTYRGFKTAWSKKQPSIVKKTAINNKEEIIKNKYSRNIDYIDVNCENLENSSMSCLSSTPTSVPVPLSTTKNTVENYKKEFLEEELCSSSSASYNNSSFLDVSSSRNISEQKKEWRELRHFYPISEKDVDMLNSRANREFSNNFVNQLLLKLYIKYPEKRFKNRFTFLSYMTQILSNEHHQGPRVNNPSFRFSCNIDEQEKRVLECEQYLIKVESSSGTCNISQVKKKIAGRFSSEISHSILTTAQFIESSSRELLTILLPENIALSDMQREILMREVCSVYGNNNCYLDRVKTELKISEAVVGKEEGNMEEAQSVSTSEPHFINPRSTPLSSLKQDSVWHQVRQALVLQYGNDIDAAWFSKAVAKECKDTKTLTITMPTRFMSDWVKNNYSHVIRRLAGSLAVKNVEYS